MSTSKLTLGVQRPVGVEHLGYGTFGLALAKGLERLGVNVAGPKSLSEYDTPPTDVGAVVWPAQPGHAAGRWKGQFTAIYSMWESTKLPECFTSNLHNFDLVLVPNDFNVEQFREFNPNTYKVPLGFDTFLWTYSERFEPNYSFEFLHCAAGAAEKARKGTDLVIQAFDLAFPKWESMKPTPHLTVKCLKLPPEARPYMTVHVGKWDISQLITLYRNSHCMVLPSRGEGWGYHPIQAVATGMPAIISLIPGHSEYSSLPGVIATPTKLVKAAPFLQGDGGEWWEADVRDIAEAMREVYDNYSHWAKQAKSGSYEAHGRFGEDKMAKSVVELVGVENCVEKKTGPWEAFTQREYCTTVTRLLGPGECDIGGTSYIFVPGEEYWVPPNVRQSLREAGYLGNPEDSRSRVELNCG